MGPGPVQAVASMGIDFDGFGNALVIDPEDFAGGSRGHDQFVTLSSRDLEVAEPILQFDGARHADRAEAVARAPVPEKDEWADFVRVKNFRVLPFLRGLGLALGG